MAASSSSVGASWTAKFRSRMRFWSPSKISIPCTLLIGWSDRTSMASNPCSPASISVRTAKTKGTSVAPATSRGNTSPTTSLASGGEVKVKDRFSSATAEFRSSLMKSARIWTYCRGPGEVISVPSSPVPATGSYGADHGLQFSTSSRTDPRSNSSFPTTPRIGNFAYSFRVSGSRELAREVAISSASLLPTCLRVYSKGVISPPVRVRISTLAASSLPIET